MNKPSGASVRFPFAGFELDIRAGEVRDLRFFGLLRKVGLES